MFKLLATATLSILAFLGFIGLLGIDIPLFSSILFYRGLELILLILLVYAFLYFFTSRNEKTIKYSSAFFSAGCISFAINMSFLIVVPVTLDRSVSVFLLADMYNRGGVVSSEQLKNDFIQIYVEQYKAIDRRLEEQVKSGNVAVTQNGNYELTTRGSNFIEFSRILASAMNIGDKFINPPVVK